MLAALIIVGLLALIAVSAALFIRIYPAFGDGPGQIKFRNYEESEHYADGKFHNRLPTKALDTSMRSLLSLFTDKFKNQSKRTPPGELPVFPLDAERLAALGPTSVIWLGHSTSLAAIDGKILLLDPMLGSNCSPVPGFGAKRFKYKQTIHTEQLPLLHAVLISHDHFDHLDYTTVQKLQGRVGRYFVPLGVGSRLVRFGVDRSLIQELDWWEEVEWEGLHLACTPARHFSGRALTDKNATLWCSWVIRGKNERIFFSGDSGYDSHFKRIGELYGPFDLTLMECGQYDPRWENIHMTPKQTVQAQLDVKGKMMIPVHWGGFSLAPHGWTEPVELVLEEGRRQGISIAVPRIGERVAGGEDAKAHPGEKWWRTVQ
ncbi:MBL fold metallo-hydrolase [Paenibacillus pinistramenti]|uniref:MBL fold metallo-hydrolase n=1 Tax=Paenibacillus pinistramenti TaxID=1768003 RepID=UPI00193AB565|nr:MBL fold metallo-hydrolase [Paenibacillus pinistramenti]